MSLIPDSVIALNERVSRLLYLDTIRHSRSCGGPDEATLKQHVVFFLQRLNVELNHPQTLSDLFSALSKPITFYQGDAAFSGCIDADLSNVHSVFIKSVLIMHKSVFE